MQPLIYFSSRHYIGGETSSLVLTIKMSMKRQALRIRPELKMVTRDTSIYHAAMAMISILLCSVGTCLSRGEQRFCMQCIVKEKVKPQQVSFLPRSLLFHMI